MNSERGWIKLAQENGGRMEVQTSVRRPTTYVAVMKWYDGGIIWGSIRGTSEAAIDSLNDRLGEDAENEFLEGSGL